MVVAGLQDGEPFLGSVGMIGTHYVDDFIVTGMTNLEVLLGVLCESLIDCSAGNFWSTIGLWAEQAAI